MGKLTDDESHQIFRRHNRGETYQSLGRQFGVSWQAAYYHAKKWEHVQEIKETGY